MLSLIIQLIQQAVLFAGTLAGAATDIKTGYIYDWITYPMIGIGILTSLAAWQTTNLILGAVIFAGLFLMYRLGKIGGGDVKAFTGIALLNPFNDINFLATAALVAAALSLIFYSIFYTIKYAKKGIDWKYNRSGAGRAMLLGAALLFYFAVMSQTGLIGAAMIYFIGVPFMLGLLFLGLQKGITKEFFQKRISLKNIEEDEILAEGANPKKLLKLMKEKVLVSPKNAAMLRRNGIKSIVVLRNLPKFGPFIFLGVAFALMQPNFFLMLIG
jgi:Flp pilus assembly protein protease CpaA